MRLALQFWKTRLAPKSLQEAILQGKPHFWWKQSWLWTELIHSLRKQLSLVGGGSVMGYPCAFASISEFREQYIILLCVSPKKPWLHVIISSVIVGFFFVNVT